MTDAEKSWGGSFFHGWLYHAVIDPAMVPVREHVKNWVPKGSAVVDFGCGTGAQLFALSELIVRGLGVDLSEAQINHARRQSAKLGHTHIEFLAADATRLSLIQDGEFDIAVISMAIHEMPVEIRIPVLEEMRRVATQLIIVDWEAQQRTPWRRIGTDFIERLAGGDHYRGFRSFAQNGGIPALLKQVGLSVIDERETSKGTMRLWRCV